MIMDFLTNPTVIGIMDLLKIGGIIWGIILASVKFGKLLGNFKTIDVKFENIDEKFKNLDKSLDMRFQNIDQRFENLDKNLTHRFDTIDATLVEIKNAIIDLNRNTTSIDADLAKLEGAFEERGKWESKNQVGT